MGIRYSKINSLFNLLLHDYPLIISNTNLQEIIKPHEKELLFKTHILEETKHITSVACPDCGNSSDILYDSDNTPYYVCSCPNGGRVVLQENEIKRYSVQLDKIFDIITGTLKKDDSISELIKGVLWNIARVKKNNKIFDVFFYRRTNVLSDDSLASSTHAYRVVLYFGRSQILNNRDFYITFFDLLDIKQKGISFSERVMFDFIKSNIKEIILESNGGLIISQELACNLKSDTPEYLFLKYLYDHFNTPVSIVDIHRHAETEYKKIKHKEKWGYESDDEHFCRKMKNNIKLKIRNDKLKSIFDKCLIPTRVDTDALAYKLGNPTA